MKKILTTMYFLILFTPLVIAKGDSNNTPTKKPESVPETNNVNINKKTEHKIIIKSGDKKEINKEKSFCAGSKKEAKNLGSAWIENHKNNSNIRVTSDSCDSAVKITALNKTKHTTKCYKVPHYLVECDLSYIIKDKRN